jgi:nucleotide-binding universal stress UspA family protein
MSTVLLLLPPDRQVTRAIATALDVAAERGAKLIAVVVIDDDASLRLATRMIDVGLLAEKLTDQVSEAMEREHRIRGDALLTEVADQARTRGIACERRLEHGDMDEVCRLLVEATGASAAVLVAEKRSWLARMLTGGEPLRPAALGGCELIIVDED